MILWIEIFLSALLALSALALTRSRDLLAVVVLLSAYSGLLVLLFAVMGAVDVAFTEAVVGTGLSTVFLMDLMRRVNRREVTRRGVPERLVAVLVCGALGGVLLLAVASLPDFGSAAAPAAEHVAPYYLEHSLQDMHTPNVVTAVLGDYRSFDTLIETAVVLTAALACLLIVRRRPA